MRGRELTAKALALHEYKSRDSGNVTKGMQQYFLFRKHVVSVIQVYTYCIKCKTFQFALLPKIYLISEIKAEPDLSLVWDELVR